MTPESRPTLFGVWLRFLRFGCLAWGGPVAQIAHLHHELVERERWVDETRFRRVLAVYQALPGPEATEMCIWFGTVARGRLGGLVAGLGFLLPGLVLMLSASWLLLGLATWPGWLLAAFAGMQAAVVALVARAAVRLWRAAVRDRLLLGVAVAAFAGALPGIPFAASLLAGGGVLALRGRPSLQLAVAAVWLAVGVWSVAATGTVPPPPSAAVPAAPGALELARTGLRAGLLTFGGAYTAIPFLQADAVGDGGWMTLPSFQDGLAIGGVLPAPLVMFGAWVGWAGGGLGGALLVTATIFLPAFVFPLLLHDLLERIVAHPRWHGFLEGVTAAVVGLIAAIAVEWIALLDSPMRAGIAAVALLALAVWRHRLAVLGVMAAAAGAGLALAC